MVIRKWTASSRGASARKRPPAKVSLGRGAHPNCKVVLEPAASYSISHPAQ
jgi:hypothetical protein